MRLLRKMILKRLIQRIKSFKNSEAQEKVNNIEEKIDEITIKEQEITSLENGNFYYLSDKKKTKIQSKIEEKKKEIYMLRRRCFSGARCCQ